jgi:hypothetical protein
MPKNNAGPACPGVPWSVPRVTDTITDQGKLNIGRDQILDRLWELATLSHEATRGSIAGQIKALSMIVAIEGLIPDRRSSPSATRPAAPPVEADIYQAERLRKQKQRRVGEEPGDPPATTKTQPAAPQVPDPQPAPKSANSSPNLDRNQTSPLNPFIQPKALNRVPEATGFAFDAVLDRANPIRLSWARDRRFSGRRQR